MNRTSTWQEVDVERAAALKDARLAAHYAAQIPASMAALLPAEDDFSHTNLLWNPAHHLLQSRPVVVGSRQVRAGLRINSLSLSIAVGDVVEDEYLLRGRTLQQVQQWLADVLEDKGITRPLKRPEHTLPDSPLATGAAFEAHGTNLAALEAWFSNAAGVLATIAERLGVAEVRTWPHHFDMAALLSIDDANADGASVNIGFSPGDAHFDTPYFYVTPWPKPKADVGNTLPSGGVWHVDGFFAAVLEGTKLPADGAAQARAVDEFLSSAFEQALAMARR